MSRLQQRLPKDLSFFTLFHRHESPPTLAALDDFEELFLFRAQKEEEGSSRATTFWIIREHDDSLWMLSMVPGIKDEESIVAWCKAPNSAPLKQIAARLVFEWLRACARHQHDSRVHNTTGQGDLGLEVDSIVGSASVRQETPLHEAVWFDDIDFVRQLLEDGMPVDPLDNDNRTPLHYAALRGSIDVARLLLRRGANRQVQDKDGASARDLARDGQSVDIVTLLEDEAQPEGVSPNPTAVTSSMNADYLGDRRAISADLSPDEYASRLLARAARWRQQEEYTASRYLLERAAAVRGAPRRLVVRAIAGLFPCRFALGEVSSIEQWLDELIGDEGYDAEARAQVVLRFARLYENRGDHQDTHKWFSGIVAMNNVSQETVARARLHLAKWHDRQGQPAIALEELDATLHGPSTSQVLHAKALLQRGSIRYTEGQTQAAIEDFTWIVNNFPAQPRLQAQALIERSKCYEELRQPDDVIADLVRAHALGGRQPVGAAASLHNYGVRCNLRGEPDNAYKYFSAVHNFDGSIWVRTNAQVNRGCYLGDTGKLDAAVREFKLARATPHIPKDVLARAVYNLGNARRLQENYRAAIRHFTDVVDMHNPPDHTLAAALCRRGICWIKLDKPNQGIRDLTRALDLPNADSEDVANALLWAGIGYDRIEECETAVTYFSRLIEMSSASEEMRIRAQWGLGDVLAETGERARAGELLNRAKEKMLAIGKGELAQMITDSIRRHGLEN